MIKGYNEQGKAFFIHGNRGRKPIHALDNSTKQTIVDLYRTKYEGTNLTHFSELLEEIEGITVHQTLYVSSLVWWEKSQLHIAVDDATGAIVGAYFDEQETLNGYYHVLEKILKTYDVPYMFYTDRRTVFEYKQKKFPSVEDDTFTQFGYACKQLGIQIKTTSVPQAKWRVE